MLKVAHLADTQIRNYERHDEFRKSYEALYESLRKENPDLIIFAGDLAHNKTRISPELVQLCSEYLRNLSKIAKLIVIPGNHDGIVNSTTRLDALTPIVNALNNPRIFYYKNSGVYPWNHQIDIVVFSCFVNESCWPTEKDIDREKINIGIYHGFVQGAFLQNGMVVSPHECKHSANSFLKLVDYLFLGDIHQCQSVGDVEYNYTEIDECDLQSYLNNGWELY